MIREFTAKTTYKTDMADITAGQTLYAIEAQGMYFAWCYTDKAFAQEMDAKLGVGPTDGQDRSTNWRVNLEDCTPSDRKAFG